MQSAWGFLFLVDVEAIQMSKLNLKEDNLVIIRLIQPKGKESPSIYPQYSKYRCVIPLTVFYLGSAPRLNKKKATHEVSLRQAGLR